MAEALPIWLHAATRRCRFSRSDREYYATVLIAEIAVQSRMSRSSPQQRHHACPPGVFAARNVLRQLPSCKLQRKIARHLEQYRPFRVRDAVSGVRQTIDAHSRHARGKSRDTASAAAYHRLPWRRWFFADAR